MRHASLIAAGCVVLVANAFALLHASRNRSSPVETEIVLTDRELHHYQDPDDSGVSLQLTWVDPNGPSYRYSAASRVGPPEAWLNRAKLMELGFDCSVDPSDKDAYSFYSKQSPRTAFVALEYNGAAWRSWLDWEERNMQANQAAIGRPLPNDYPSTASSQLVLIDAALTPAALRVRYAERDRVVIVPAVIRVSVFGPNGPDKRSYLSGFVQEIPSTIHVQRPFSDRFREAGHVWFRDGKSEEPLYRVRLRYGALLEPWVVGVELLK